MSARETMDHTDLYTTIQTYTQLYRLIVIHNYTRQVCNNKHQERITDDDYNITEQHHSWWEAAKRIRIFTR